ncbi:MAG: APC family permease [Chloroflexota bacterium]|nr:MAG: APC family permease [Chloroflexota bacterium]
MAANTNEPQTTEKTRTMTLRGAVFLGIGSMVGAGIFALFGQAGSIAGAAVWVSFLVSGIIALLQGYSFAKLGARFPSSGGVIDWIMRGYGKGMFTGGIVMLGFFSYLITVAMVAVSFGNYAASLFLGENASPLWVKVFAAGVVIVLTFLNMVGAQNTVKAQTILTTIVLIILTGFAIALLTQINPTMLAPVNYPPMTFILASVALTFFSYLGFGVLAFTGGDIQEPQKNMPRAMYISLGFTMLLYIALALGVFGTLTVDQVIEHAETALAAAALPIFGEVGFTLISIAAVFACAGAINATLYATLGASHLMAQNGILPPAFGAKYRGGTEGSRGLALSAVAIVLMAVLFDLGAIASVGSAVVLAISVLVTIAHLRMTQDTQASKPILWIALLSALGAVLVFAAYTLITDPMTFVALTATIILAWLVEWIWIRMSKRRVSSAT